jgi:LysM repeat protein
VVRRQYILTWWEGQLFVISRFCAIIRFVFEMAEEPEISLPTEEQRQCPYCGARVAVMATTCLMCGTSLETGETEPEEEVPEKGLPRWAKPLIVVALALVFLVVGFYGLYLLMNAQPEDTSPTPTATRTPTNTPIPTPTRTPAPTLTPTPLPPLTYQVRTGDTLSDIAARFDTTVEDILALNPEVQPEFLSVGYVLRIPAGTLTPTPTPILDPSIPTPTPGNFVIHIVKQGDTLESIAEEHGVSVALIREANPEQLPVGSDSIFVGQSLVVPLGTPVPSPTPTVDPLATPTPAPPYDPPALLSPPDGATLVSVEAPVALQWMSIAVLQEGEWYEATLFFPDGTTVHKFQTRTTVWRVPFDLLMKADGEVPEFQWQVMVAREVRDEGGELTYEKASLVSETRVFEWVKPTPTPTPSPTSES